MGIEIMQSRQRAEEVRAAIRNRMAEVFRLKSRWVDTNANDAACSDYFKTKPGGLGKNFI